MSYNGSGTFNINTAGQPVVTGTTITSTAFNLLTADLATGLSTALTKDGQTTPTANIPLGGFKITGLGAGTAATDAAQYGQLQAGATTIATVTGTDTYVGTLSPAIAAYATGNLFSFVAPNTNTGAATINLNSLGAKNITKLGSTALAAGDIVSGRVYQIEYDGTRFQLLNPSASSVASFSAGSTGFTPSSATTGAVTLAGTLATTNGGTGLTSFTSGGVVYASSSSALATGSALVFDGTNLGLGVTPSAWSASYKAIQLGGGTSIWSGASGNQPSFYSNNLYFNGSNRIYLQNGYATEYVQSTSGTHSWYTAPSGTAGNAITFTQAMTLDASGNLGIGTTSPATRLNVSSTGNGNRALFDDTTNDNTLGIYSDSTDIRLLSLNNSRGSYKRLGFQSNVMVFSASNGSESARIDTSGNLLVNSTSGSNHQIKKAVSVGSAVLEVIGNNVGCTFYNGDGGTPNAANAVLKVTSVGATGRSINAAGTVNAAGLDYAEYMTKSGDFTVAKGDVVGIDAQGKLTNVFANAVSFVVKSTNPSYVGGDTWGGDIEGDELEAARQTVDRIAFAGQVPVNVLGATAGQYIIPVNDNGAIKGQAVSNPTFEQYQSSVGKVIAIEADGRARIIVKVA